MNDEPIVVSGMGGSGTRLVCQIVREAGVFMGADLNYADDSLPLAHFTGTYLSGKKVRGDESLKEAISKHCAGMPEGAQWGWKEPHAYLMLWYFNLIYPTRMRFVHVLRDGRDMAYAPITGLPVFWTGDMPGEGATPREVMTLWMMTNMQAANFGEHVLWNYHQVRFEDLCSNPEPHIKALYKFLELQGDVGAACELVKPPGSIGRWQGAAGEELEEVLQIGRTALERFGYL